MGKPQELPAGDAQLRFGIALALLTYVMALAVPFGIGRALLQALIDLGVTGFTLWVALSLMGRSNRFEQAFGGLCGASAFVNLAAAPLYLTRPDVSSDAGSSLGALPDYVLLVWSLSLLAHVIRHTFEIKIAMSVFVSFIYFLLLMTIMSAIIAPIASSGDNLQSFLTIQPPESISNLLPVSPHTTFSVVTSSTRVL